MALFISSLRLIFTSQSCETCRIIAFGDEGDQVPHPEVLKSTLGPDCEPESFLAKSHRGSSRALPGTCVCCAGSSDEQDGLGFIWLSLLR